MHIQIIVPAFDVAPYLAACLRSVIGQTYSDWALTIVDDGSSDGTSDIAASFSDSRIRLIRQNRSGVSAARNAGIAALPSPRSPWFHQDQEALLFLDADDWLAADALSRLVETLTTASWAVAACGRYARAGMDGAVRPAPPPPEGCLLERLLTRNLFANGGHLLIRREAIEATGLFRSELSYGEDWEYWTRLAQLGEFTAVRSRHPVLFVRERHGGARLTRAADPAADRPALEAIYRNPAVASRFDPEDVTRLRTRADAESAWAAGRELIRHGQIRAGQQWLGRALRQAPSLKRLALIGLSGLRTGPFRPYPAVS